MAEYGIEINSKNLIPFGKVRVQSLLQAAYTKNAEGFYVTDPNKRSSTSLKKILEYISHYMKHGLIALNRILVYDGTMVMF